MLFLEAIQVGQNWGWFLMWCSSPSTKRHKDTTTSRLRLTLFRLTVECWADSTKVFLQPDERVMSCMRASNCFHTRPYDGQFLQRKWCHCFVVKPSSNLISYPVKNSKFQLVCCFSRWKYQRTKSRFVTTAISVEPWIWKLVRIFFEILQWSHQ